MTYSPIDPHYLGPPAHITCAACGRVLTLIRGRLLGGEDGYAHPAGGCQKMPSPAKTRAEASSCTHGSERRARAGVHGARAHTREANGKMVRSSNP